MNMNTENVVKKPSGPDYQKIIRYVVIGVVALIVLSLVISIIGALIPDKFETSGKNYIHSLKNDDGEYVLIFNGKKPITLSDDVSAKIDEISFDYENKYAVALATTEEENDDGETERSSELYVITSKGEEVVAEDVSNYVLSAYGDTIVYINYDKDLFVGKIGKAEKAKKIASDVYGLSAISPDGSAIVYKTVEEKDDKETTQYFLSVNGKEGEKFGDKDKNYTFLGVSDGGKYVYYYKSTDDGRVLYVNDLKLVSDDQELVGVYCFNRDGSQLVFSSTSEKDESKTYFVNKAKEKVELEDGEFNNILVVSDSVSLAGSVPTINVSSLVKCAFMIGDNYYYLKNTKGEVNKLGELKNADSIELLDDGKTVVFIKNGSLRTYDITKANKSATEYESDDDIYSFTTTSEGEHIYVRDENDTLYYVKSKSKMVKISDDVKRAVAIEGGKVYYINEDDELYYAKKSGAGNKVTDDVTNVYYYDEAGDVYTKTEDSFYSVNGKKAKKILNIG